MSAKDKVSQAKSIVRGVAGQGGDLVNVMLTLVVAGVAGFVGVYALAETETAISMPTDSSLNGSLEALGGGLSSAFGLAPIVFIVLMLSVAIFYLIRLRGRQ
jgi:uncharacterized membrane protein YoaK (UPF0700 family)